MRLALLILAVAPVALAGALCFAAATPASTDRVARVRADVRLGASALATQLARAEGSLRDLAANEVLARALGGGGGSSSALERARDLLAGVEPAAGGPQGTVRLIDADGRVRLRAGAAAGDGGEAGRAPSAWLERTLELSAGTIGRSTDGTADDGASLLTLALPISDANGRTQGLVALDLPLRSLAETAAGTMGGGFALLLRPADGAVVADTRATVAAGEPPAAATLSGLLPGLLRSDDATLDRLLDAGWAAWAEPVGEGPEADWAALVVAPLDTAPGLPLPLVGGAVGLALLAVVLAAWLWRALPRARGAPAGPAWVAGAVLAPATSLAPTARSDELHDPLTGLGNHRAFQEELDRLIAAHERNGVPFAMLLIDVDDLRIVNERHGHAVGDDRLRALGERIRAALRFSDRAFRIGDDEFAVLLPHADAPGAVTLGLRLLPRPADDGGDDAAVAFSAGASAYPTPAASRELLHDQAAAALAWVKQHGRHGVDVYDPLRDVRSSHTGDPAIDAAVAGVIRDRSLKAVFQPIVDLVTGEVVGYEGLTRPQEDGPFDNPQALFQAAEQVGRIVELDGACFEVIARAAGSIPTDRVVSINLSPRTLEAPDFSVRSVLATLQRCGLETGRVILELTEREDVHDLERLRQNVAELQRVGLRIAADDVGAGNAGLRLLSQFRFDIVKVDLSLVQDGISNEASLAVVRSLRDLAHRWDALVIAEGIETPEHLKMVRELGMAAGQGYLIGRPGTLVDLPPVDLDGLQAGHLMMQNAPVIRKERTSLPAMPAWSGHPGLVPGRPAAP